MELIGASHLLVCDDSFSILKEGGILYNASEILEVGSYEKLLSKNPNSSKFYENCVLTPAFANLHTHFEFSQNAGILQYGSFESWLNSVIENREHLMDEGLEESIKQAIKKNLKSGVSFVGAISSYGYDLEILANSPLRVLYFNEAIGSKKEALPFLFSNLKERLKESQKFSSERFYPALAIHSPYSVHSELLNDVLTLAREENLPLSVHFLESSAELEWLQKGSGYFLEFFRKFFKEECKPFYNPLEFLEYFKDNKGAYFVHLLEADRTIREELKKLEAKVISCPRSNRLLNNKLLALKDFRQNGFKTIFATDGLSSNDSLSLLDELRIALYAYANEPLETLAQELILGISNYAFRDNPMGLKAGILQKGYVSDFALFKLEAKEQIPLQLILYAKEVESLYIAGKKIEF
ncbi:aminofutalosine deaminase family hydrolase [Helicobacter burdigaliensis]|uniref:aminofutalosine deaminase family hydrolase n=1 Tax=Helicobacter burdigaliensis TaxID=2315334 RepID=UPI000EF658E7|nr:aminofutalosine deaminase family hydrolase [Helicobacter burdigaliensis]